ncbi:MAG: endolytic transglycosylase MltG [Chloroflexaceae bacterium]|nr:endolytic transglycosylase MltG [Chloroflexaceae bacterium]NJO05342.1 endolytic transglycosylase MltG [Chloroflexaceae bacterium]
MRYIRALMLGITLIALLAACVSYAMLREVTATSGSSEEPVEIVIEDGATTSDIATLLRAEGLIRQPLLFTSLVRMQNLDGKLQAGRYLLWPSMTLNEILLTLQQPAMAEEVQITVPEGLRLEEIASIVANTNIVSGNDFMTVARDADRFRDDYFLIGTLPPGVTLEGYLFPDTYRIAATATAEDIVRLMLDRFVQVYNDNIDQSIQVAGVTPHDIVTMASIVQRESARGEEMPTIAAVFWNRLDPENVAETGNGRLQADATVQYALGYSSAEQTWWRKQLTADDLSVDNPYNTRARPGLPAGPISAPGLAALEAAAQPDSTAEYLYFVASCEFDGTHNFATSFEEFQQYEAEYLQCSSENQ